MRASKSQKKFRLALIDNYFSDLFTEVQMWYWKTGKFGLARFFRKNSQIESFISTTKNLLTKTNWNLPVVHYFTWKLQFLSKISSMVIVLYYL